MRLAYDRAATRDNYEQAREAVEKVLARIECQPWRLIWNFDRCRRVQITAIHGRDMFRDDYVPDPNPRRFACRSTRTADILEAAFEAIEFAERERIRDRFTYRGRDVFSPRYFAGRDPLSPRNSLASLVEEIDRAELVSNPPLRAEAVNSFWGFILK